MSQPLHLTEPAPPAAAQPWRVRALLWLAGVAWVLPLWLVRYLPMVDYPQQLAVASILRYYNDPSRLLRQAYEPALLRPQGLFEMLAAGLAWLLPIEHAGKVVLALSLALVVPAAVALCRRTGRPDWYALFALAVTYNHAFYWGFADNLLAYPLVLAGGALADRLFDRPRCGWREWLPVAACCVLFYGIHLQFLLVFAGLAGWLAVARRAGWKRLAVRLSALVPGLALGIGVLGWLHLHAAQLMTGYQERLQSARPYHYPLLQKIGSMPQDFFGNLAGGGQYLLMAILMLAILALAVPFSRPEPRPPARSDGGPMDMVHRSRFLVPALGLFVLYFVLPEFASGYFVSQRILSLAFMLAVPALPVPRSAVRRRVAALLLGGLLVVQAGQTAAGFVSFGAETAGLEELLAGTEPGQALAGLMYSKLVSDYDWPPVLTQFPAYYQVEKGGRIHFSFVQFFNSPVRYRPGQNWEDGLLAEWDEWSPQKFSYPRHGRYFRYFLLCGDPEHVRLAFGPYLEGLRVRSAGRWFLIERPPGDLPAAPPRPPGDLPRPPGDPPHSEGAGPEGEGGLPRRVGALPLPDGGHPLAGGGAPHPDRSVPLQVGAAARGKGMTARGKGMTARGMGMTAAEMGGVPIRIGGAPAARGWAPSGRGTAPSLRGGSPSCPGRALVRAPTCLEVAFPASRDLYSRRNITYRRRDHLYRPRSKTMFAPPTASVSGTQVRPLLDRSQRGRCAGFGGHLAGGRVLSYSRRGYLPRLDWVLLHIVP